MDPMVRESSSKQVMQIGELANSAGVSVRAVRYYEELGLIQPASHSQGGFRLYGEECLKRLRVINFLKEMGLSLGEIQRIFFAKRLQGGNKGAVRYLQGVFSEKLSLVNTKIETLNRMKAEITNALKILRVCESCDHKVLLDAVLCGECALLESNEAIPDTFKVILQ
jgi:MerR family transcriptional regulator, Zn(II)-responsive regulator of zntA